MNVWGIKCHTHTHTHTDTDVHTVTHTCQEVKWLAIIRLTLINLNKCQGKYTTQRGGEKEGEGRETGTGSGTRIRAASRADSARPLHMRWP